MTYVLSDGTYELTTKEDSEEKLRRVLDEKLGRDAEEWLTDVISAAEEAAAEKAVAEMDKGFTLISSRIDGLLYHLKDYVGSPDSLRKQLKNIQSEIEEYMPVG